MPPKLFGHFTPKPSHNNKCSTKSRSQSRSRSPWHAVHSPAQPAGPPKSSWPWPRLWTADWRVQSMHSHVAIRRQWASGERGALRCAALLCSLLCCMRQVSERVPELVCRGRQAWQLGRAKLFSMHALKGAERFCVLPENICPPGIPYIRLSLTLRLAKLFDKPLSMFAQRSRGRVGRQDTLQALPLRSWLIPSRGASKCNYRQLKATSCQLAKLSSRVCPTRISRFEYSENSSHSQSS